LKGFGDSVGVAGSTQECVGKVTGRDAIMTTLDGLAKLLDPMPTRLMLRAERRRREYNLL
jgi:hypothetical protein